MARRPLDDGSQANNLLGFVNYIIEARDDPKNVAHVADLLAVWQISNSASVVNEHPGGHRSAFE